MVKITQQVKDFLKDQLAYVATVDAKGTPNVVPKGDMAVLGDNVLVFADLYSHQTKSNLKGNPNIAVSVVNPAAYAGYQLKGKAEIIQRGIAYNKLARAAAGAGQLNHPQAKYAVKIKINKIIDIGYGVTQDKEL